MAVEARNTALQSGSSRGHRWFSRKTALLSAFSLAQSFEQMAKGVGFFLLFVCYFFLGKTHLVETAVSE